MPEMTEAKAAFFIAGLFTGLWLILFGGIVLEHIRANRRPRA